MYLLEIADAENLGWEKTRGFYKDLKTAMKAFDKEVEYHIQMVIEDNDMTEEEQKRYREEVEESSDIIADAIKDKGDPDGEWYVALYDIE